MVNYLFYENICDSSIKNRIGGDACLPNTVTWPKDKNNRNMLFLMTLSGELISMYTKILIPKNLSISVFIPYTKNSITDTIQMARSSDIAKVIIHENENFTRQENDTPLLPARKISIKSEDIEDEDEFSDEIEEKIGGVPTWLQDKIDYEDYEFVLQILGTEFGKYFPEYKNIFLGGVGYLFFSKSTKQGIFQIQYT